MQAASSALRTEVVNQAIDMSERDVQSATESGAGVKAETYRAKIQDLKMHGVRRAGDVTDICVCVECGEGLRDQPQWWEPGSRIDFVVCAECAGITPLGRHPDPDNLITSVLKACGLTALVLIMLAIGFGIFAGFHALVLGVMNVQVDWKWQSGGQIAAFRDAPDAPLKFLLFAAGAIFLNGVVGLVTALFTPRQLPLWVCVGMAVLPLLVGGGSAFVRLLDLIANERQYHATILLSAMVVLVPGILAATVAVVAIRRFQARLDRRMLAIARKAWERKVASANRTGGAVSDDRHTNHADMVCDVCQYSLKGLSSKREPITGIAVLECPECGSCWPMWDGDVLTPERWP